MQWVRIMVMATLVASAGGGSVLQAAQPAAQPAAEEQVDEFIPIDQLPPQDQLPAAPLLITAYAFALVALFGYVWSVARRVQGVAQDVSRLEQDVKDRTRTP